MKQNIHPNWHNDCVVTCACGNTFITGSSQETITVEICGACHPFFTGEMRFVDTQGRVDRFMQKMNAASGTTKLRKKSKQSGEVKSYRQLLQEQKETLKSLRSDQAPSAQQKAQKTASQASAATAAA